MLFEKPSKKFFKRELNKTLLCILQSEDMFINTSMIIPKIQQVNANTKC
jgi:hypothetical protein